MRCTVFFGCVQIEHRKSGVRFIKSFTIDIFTVAALLGPNLEILLSVHAGHAPHNFPRENEDARISTSLFYSHLSISHNDTNIHDKSDSTENAHLFSKE